MKKATPVLLVVAYLATACAGGQPRPVNHAAAAPTQDFNLGAAKFTVSEPIAINVDLSFNPINGDALATSVRIGQQNAAMVGSSPGAGLVGAVVATQIMVAAGKQAGQDKANEPIRELNALLAAQDRETFWPSQFGIPKASPTRETSLRLAPVLRMTPDYRSLSLSVWVERVSDGEVHYRNEFEYVSAPISGGSVDASRRWAEDDGVIFFTTLRDSTAALREMIEGELNQPLAALTPAAGPIRYSNQSGEFYERGHVLRVQQNRLVFRTLRGAMKSVYYQNLVSFN